MTAQINNISIPYVIAHFLTPPCLKTNTSSKQIRQLTAHPETWNKDKQSLVLDILSSNRFYLCKKSLKGLFHKLDAVHLHHLLQASAEMNPGSPHINKTPLAFQRLQSLLTLNQIEAALKTEFTDYKSSLETARELCLYAKYYMDVKNPEKITPFLHKALNTIIWSLELGIETLLSSFGILQIIDDSDPSYDAYTRLQSTLQIIAAVSALATLGAAITGSFILGGVFAGIGFLASCAALAIYIKFIKPAPRSLGGCVNLTNKAASGDLEPVEGRQQIIDMLAASIIAKEHILIIGPSGVGKTEIVKGFAQCIANGRYPELKGKQVFMINTAEVVNDKPGQGRIVDLDNIKRKIKHRPEDVILFFDEIHEATRGSKRNNLSERLKSLLDEGKENFQHVIGSTTADEFTKHILPNDALTRRFKVVPIASMTRDQTLAILNNILLKHSDLVSSPEVIEAIYDKSIERFPERPQPFIATRILRQAITQAKHVKSNRLLNEIEQVEAVLHKNLSTALTGNASSLIAHKGKWKMREEENAQLMEKIRVLKEELAKERAHEVVIQTIIDLVEKRKKSLFKLALMIRHQIEKKKDASAMLKKFTLEAAYLTASSENLLKAYTSLHGNRFPKIDLALIDSIVEQEVKLQTLKAEMTKPSNHLEQARGLVNGFEGG